MKAQATATEAAVEPAESDSRDCKIDTVSPRRSQGVEYGRWPNGSLVGRVPGALPLAMLRKAFGRRFWPTAMFIVARGNAPGLCHVPGFLAKGPIHHSLQEIKWA